MARAGSPAGVGAPGRALVGVPTLRTDRWWRSPLITMLGLLAFIVYATWAAFIGKNYFFEPYISPFYSPCLAASCASSGAPSLGIFGTWWPLSPALIILIFPLGFRLTCYYYRKAYYRSFWRSPAACGVPEPHQKYTGETRFPLILQNIHRYFFFFGLLFNVILTWDAIIAFRNHDGQWFHAGIGTVVLRDQRGVAVAVLDVLPFLPAPGRRSAAALLQTSGPILGLDEGLGAERAPHAVRLALSRVGWRSPICTFDWSPAAPSPI